MKIAKTLLEKFCRNECTSEETQAIREWLADGSWSVLPEQIEVPADLRKKVWDKLHGKIHPVEQFSRVRKLQMDLIRVAAVILVVIGTGVSIYYHYHSHERITAYVTHAREHQKITLPDSSIVFLSANSILKVLPSYGKGKRDVDLTGQAVFEVAHHASSPFSVVSGAIITTALGTSFKVTSYPGLQDIKVAISYGKIVVKDKMNNGEIHNIYLDPGEEVVYDKATQALQKTVSGIKPFDYKTNILYFKDAGAREVVEKLEEYYHVQVQYNSLKYAQWSVSGEFYYQPLDVVMKAIAYSCNVQYKINGNILKINAKN